MKMIKSCNNVDKKLSKSKDKQNVRIKLINS